MTTTFWAWAAPTSILSCGSPTNTFPTHFANKKNFNNLYTLSTPIWLEVITEATIYMKDLCFMTGAMLGALLSHLNPRRKLGKVAYTCNPSI